MKSLDMKAAQFAMKVFSAALLLGCVAPALIAAQDKPVATPPASKPDPYQPTEAPLDKRIGAPEKITQADPPPLPQHIVLPKPPQHAISTKAEEVPIKPELWQTAQESLKKGLSYLRSVQDESGGWLKGAKAAPTDQPDRPSPITVAVTALIVKSFVQADPKAVDDQAVRKAMRVITSAHNPDGSFDNGSLANYVHSAVLMALSAIGDRDVHDYIFDLKTTLTTTQWDQGEGLSPRQDWFGGGGYGNSGRPDLSNTQMMLDALYDSGMSPDEPAFQKALAFVSRTQNLKQTNKAEWAGNDGGFVYTPANGGESMASEVAGEGRYGEQLVASGQPRSLRSYGSMTYAGFKSMLYAGLSQDDVRVRAAFDWIRHHWTFDENPGLGQQGLYYYYHTLARALTIAQQNEITDAQGTKHNWREEMIEALLKRQREDGSWVNEAHRWEEGQPELVTAYCVLALEEILKPATGANASRSLD